MGWRWLVVSAVLLVGCGDAERPELLSHPELAPPERDASALRPGDGSVVLTLVSYEDLYGDIVAAPRVVVQTGDPCAGSEPPCASELDVMVAAAADLETVAVADCENCPATVTVLIESRDGTHRAVSAAELIGSLAPIDTGFEAVLVVGDSGLVRPVGQAWHVRTGRTVSSCEPFTIRETLHEVQADGSVEEIATFDDVDDDACV